MECPRCFCPTTEEATEVRCTNPNCGWWGKLSRPAPAAAVPLARNSDPETSVAAATHMVVSGKLGQHQARALEAVRAYPDRTATELARSMGDGDPRKINRRLGELETAGLVSRGAARRCSITNRSAATWRAKD